MNIWVHFIFCPLPVEQCWINSSKPQAKPKRLSDLPAELYLNCFSSLRPCFCIFQTASSPSALPLFACITFTLLSHTSCVKIVAHLLLSRLPVPNLSSPTNSSYLWKGDQAADIWKDFIGLNCLHMNRNQQDSAREQLLAINEQESTLWQMAPLIMCSSILSFHWVHANWLVSALQCRSSSPLSLIFPLDLSDIYMVSPHFNSNLT